jgi:hypothetical protein
MHVFESDSEHADAIMTRVHVHHGHCTGHVCVHVRSSNPAALCMYVHGCGCGCMGVGVYERVCVCMGQLRGPEYPHARRLAAAAAGRVSHGTAWQRHHDAHSKTGRVRERERE